MATTNPEPQQDYDPVEEGRRVMSLVTSGLTL